MTSYRSKIKLNLTQGIVLPIFLISLFAPALTIADQTLPRSNIIFKTANVEALKSAYVLQDTSFVFVDPKNEEFKNVYKASIPVNLLNSFNRDSRVIYSELNASFKVSAITPNDHYFTTSTLDDTRQWYLPKIKMPEAWEYTKGSSNVVVAVIDTGIHASHIELNDGRIIAGYNVLTLTSIRSDSNSDDNGHGTAVAGVIGAIPHNSIGIAGINWQVKIMPVKALAADGTGDVAALASGIIWATDHGANIINLSLGGPGFGADKTLNDAIAYAYNHDVVIVAAAGNDLAEQGVNLDTNPVYPICSDQGKNMVIGVAATDTSDQKADFSNFGINCVDITAPGRKILTTAFLPSDPSDSVLIYASGTSLAVPMVSGVAALIKANNLDLSNFQIRDLLLKTTDNIDALNKNNCLGTSCSGFLGRGRLNAYNALSPQPLTEGSLVRENLTGRIYRISAGKKHYVSSFVFNQRRLALTDVVQEYNGQLLQVPTGDSLPPLEGTLVKDQNDPTVYVIHQEMKRPLTFLVFQSRGFKFSDVKVMPNADLAEVKLGEWYWPPDDTTVLISGDPTVYIMDKGVRRPVTYFVFTQRKLSFAKVVKVTLDEFGHIPKPQDSYWLPPQEGTLVKSSVNATVYLIQNFSRKPLSFEAFTRLGLKFSDIIALPQAEVDVILPGPPILN